MFWGYNIHRDGLISILYSIQDSFPQNRNKIRILEFNSSVDQIKFQEAYFSIYQENRLGIYLLYYWYFGMGFEIGNNWFAAGLIHSCMLSWIQFTANHQPSLNILSVSSSECLISFISDHLQTCGNGNK